jgi:hypothetical protein
MSTFPKAKKVYTLEEAVNFFVNIKKIRTCFNLFSKAKLPPEFKLEYDGTYYLITHNEKFYLEVDSVKQLKLAIKEIKENYSRL